MNRIMKQTTILVGLCAAAAWGQWLPAGATSGTIYYTGGNVGVGTTSPRNYGPPAYNTLAVDGTTSGVLNVQANGSTVLQLYGDSTAGYMDNGGTALPLIFRVDGEKMRITAGGNIGIGTTSPNSAYLLDVKGAIGAADIYVAGNALPDYVFDADYRNTPLSEVAAYIDQNHHLPGMPSAAEAQKSGLSVGDMQNKLLQKVEELTLHMIAAEERIDWLEQRNRELQERLARLEARSGEVQGRSNGESK